MNELIILILLLTPIAVFAGLENKPFARRFTRWLYRTFM